MSMEQLRTLCVRMKELQERKDRLDEESSNIGAELDNIRLKKIPEMMANLELKNATFDGIGRVQLATDLYASTRAGKKDAAIQWLRDLGYENMVSETYNASSLKALFRRQIEQGIEIPADLFSVTPFIRASIVKA